MDKKEYQAGCIKYHGGEIKHHKDCVFYKDSFTEMYDKLKQRIAWRSVDELDSVAGYYYDVLCYSKVSGKRQVGFGVLTYRWSDKCWVCSNRSSRGVDIEGITHFRFIEMPSNDE